MHRLCKGEFHYFWQKFHLGALRKLAGQTIIYGFSNIVSRLLNYLLVPYYTHLLSPGEYGPVNIIYAIIPFLFAVYTYGLETSYFRFSQNRDDRPAVLGTTSISIICSTLLFTFLLLHYKQVIAGWITLPHHPEYVTYFAWILLFDTLGVIPFARLRLEDRPVKYAFIKVSGIIVNILFNVFFLSVCPALLHHGHRWVVLFYNPYEKIGYIFIANILSSAFAWILLWKEFFRIQWRFDFGLWWRIMKYSLPLVIVGFAGMVNETMDRAWFLPHYLPYDHAKNDYLIGIYSANYKLAILITLFIQAFRLGAEPFFFQQSTYANARQTYARVMKYFVMVVSIMFLFVALYLPIWKLFLRRPAYWEGLYVVPYLLAANMFLGIYYNLTIWFKLTDRTRIGAYITLFTALLAFVLNYWWIPIWGYFGSALATMVCYLVQMIICYVLGQKYYPIPYAVKKLVSIMIMAFLFYAIYWLINRYFLSPGDPYRIALPSLLLATVLFCTYLYLLYKIEKPYLRQLSWPKILKNNR
jgi:O-antigen/teichoic acid export membrane protein